MIRPFYILQVAILVTCILLSGCALFGGGGESSDYKAAIGNLKHKEPNVRVKALQDLQVMVSMHEIPNPEEVLPLVIELFIDEDPVVRAWAYDSALPVAGISTGSFGLPFEVEEKEVRKAFEMYPAMKELIPHFINALNDESKIVRLVAVQELMELAPLSRDAVPELGGIFADMTDDGKVELVGDLPVANDDLRALALTALTRIGDIPKELTPSVLDFLKDEEKSRRLGALEALKQIGPAPGVVEAVIEIIYEEDDGGVLTQALNTVRSFGADGAGAVPAITGLLDKDIKTPMGTQHFKSTLIHTLRVLGLYSDDAIPALIGFFDDEDETIREHAVLALPLVGLKPGVIEALLGALKDEDPDMRGYAAQGLGRFIDKADTLIPILEEVVANDENEEVRGYAGFAIDRLKGIVKFHIEFLDKVDLEKYKDDPEGLFKELVSRFGEGEMLARQYAVNTLAEQFPQQAYPVLMDALEDDDPLLRAAVPMALGKIGKGNPQTVQALMKALDDEDRDVRTAAAMGVCLLQEEAIVALPKLLEMLKDEDEVVRGKVAEAFGYAGGLAPEEVVPALIALFEDEESYPRRSAGRSLVSYGQGAVTALIGNLETDNKSVLLHSLQSLALLVKGVTQGYDHWEAAVIDTDLTALLENEQVIGAIPLIIDFMGDQDKGIRAAAKEIAICVSPDEAVAKLIELLSDNNAKCDAISFLRDLEPMPAEAVPVLIQIIEAGEFEDADPESDEIHFVEECVFALAEYVPDKVEAIEPMIGLLSSNHAGIRHATAWALGEFGPDAANAVDALIELLSEESPGIRYNAALSLGKIGTPATHALPKMQETAANEKNSEVRRALQEAMQKILLAAAGVSEPEDEEE